MTESTNKTLTKDTDLLVDGTTPSQPSIQSGSQWARETFPDVAKVVAIPFHEHETKRNGFSRYEVLNLNDEFFALALGTLGRPASPTVYVASEGKFYTYEDESGTYRPAEEGKLITTLSMWLDLCMANLGANNISERFFSLKSPNRLQRVVDRAKTLLAMNEPFFIESWDNYLPLANGVYDHGQKKLLPFSPKHHFQSTLPVRYEEGARCDVFLQFMGRVLPAEDVELLQRYLGQLVMGKNYAQRILILNGAAGWGKGTLLRMVQGILGSPSIGIIRESLFNDSRELGCYAGRSLLYHPDMPSLFLNHPHASLLKQLVGGDPLWADVEGVAKPIEMQGNFNVILSCNGVPVIRQDQDTEAWNRRLAVVQFHEPTHDRLGKVSDLLLMKESAGFLNWLLEGREKFYKDQCQLKLTHSQQERVDRILNQLEPHLLFFRQTIVAQPDGFLILTDCYRQFRDFCVEHGLSILQRKKFKSMMTHLIFEKYGLNLRHDVRNALGKQQEGWKGLICRFDEPRG